MKMKCAWFINITLPEQGNLSDIYLLKNGMCTESAILPFVWKLLHFRCRIARLAPIFSQCLGASSIVSWEEASSAAQVEKICAAFEAFYSSYLVGRLMIFL